MVSKKKKLLYYSSVGVTPETYIIPSEFSSVFSNQITRIGNELSTDFSFTALDASLVEVACYVDPTAAGGGTGTIGSPFNNLATAVANTSYNTYYLKAGTRCMVTAAMSIVRSIKFKKYGSGADPEVATQIVTNSWAVNGTHGNVYQHANALTTLTVGSVFDESNLDVNGIYTGLRRVTSIAEVSATANTYFYDATADIIYVRTFNDRAPDSAICCLVSSTTLRLFQIGGAGAIGSNFIVYMENIRIYGALPVVIRNTSSTFYWQFGFTNCQFNYAGQKDGIFISGHARGFFNNCRADHNVGDGFNYANVENTFIFEWFCSGWYNDRILSSGNNGSTGHENVKIIRAGGSYEFSGGKPVQDINNVVSYSLRCTARNSSGSDPNDAGYASDSTDSGTCKMWLIECIGPTDANKFWNFSTSEMNIYDGDVGNLLDGANRQDLGSVTNILIESQVYQ